MTRYTHTKINRMYEMKNIGTFLKPIWKKFKRDVMRPAIKRFAKPCPLCKNPMMLSIGQIQFAHKNCRDHEQKQRRG